VAKGWLINFIKMRATARFGGTGTLAKTISNFPTTTQTYPVYARLFSATTLPEAGTYTDTVTVTLTY